MTALIWKEIREHKILLMFSIGLICVVTVLHWVLSRMNPGYILTDNDSYFSVIFFIWVVMASASMSDALAGDRDRGSDRFVQSLPISPVHVWMIKVGIAIAVTVSVLLATYIIALPIGRHEILTEILFSNRFFTMKALITVAVCALFASAVFRRSFTALISSIVMAILLVLTLILIRIFWLWFPETPFWSLLTGGTGLAIGSLLIYRRAAVYPGSERRCALRLLLLIILISATVMSWEYIHTFYTVPDPAETEHILLAPGNKYLIFQNDVYNPLFAMDIRTGELKRLTKRFEETDFSRGISPSGKTMTVYNHRGFLGRFTLMSWGLTIPRHMRADENTMMYVNNLLQSKESAYFSDLRTEIVTVESGESKRISSPDTGSMMILMGWDGSEDICYFSTPVDARFQKSDIYAYKPGSDTLKRIDRIEGLAWLSRDNKSLVAVEFIQGNPPKPRFNYRPLTGGEWHQTESFEDIPYRSPDNRWAYRAVSEPGSNTQKLYLFSIENPDSEPIPLGTSTKAASWAEWSATGDFLICWRDSEPEGTEWVILNTASGTPIERKNDARMLRNARFDSPPRFLKFSPDDAWLAFSQDFRDAETVIAPLEGTEKLYSLKNTRPLGWIDNRQFLFLDEETGNLSVCEPASGSIKPLRENWKRGE